MASTVDLLPANLQNSLHELIDTTNLSGGGIRVILLSTAEGVPLGRAYAQQDRHNNNNNINNNPNSQLLNEDVLANLESTWAPASKQLPLLHMGKEVKMVTAIYDQRKWNEKRTTLALLLQIVVQASQMSHITNTVATNIENDSPINGKSLHHLLYVVASCFCTSFCTHSGTIFHVYQAPIVVTILVDGGGGTTANLGAVRSTAVPLLKQVLEPLCTTLLDSLAAPADNNTTNSGGSNTAATAFQ